MSSRSAHNRYLREQNTPEVIQFCKDNGFTYKWMDGDWHLRIEGQLDIYPTRRRYFWLPGKEWGWYTDNESLYEILSERIK